MRHHDEAGMSLIEIVIAIVVLGGVVSALMSGLVTASTASKQQRDLVVADAVLRDYAEATKLAVETSCTGAGATFTVGYAPPDSRFTVNDLGTQTCPAVTATLPVTLTVTLPNGSTKSLAIDVRTP